MDVGHSHAPPSSPPVEAEASARWREARRVTLAGGAMRIALAATELTLGLVFQSRALVADTIHTLSDVVSDVVVWFALRFASRPADETYPFGRGKMEALAALIVAGLLTAAGIGIAVEAGSALVGGGHREPSGWPLVGAVLGIAVQEFSFRWTLRVGQRIRSTALVANAWHHRSDVLSSVAVLLGVGGAKLFDLWWLDPVAAVAVAGMILKIAVDVLRESFRGLLDASVPAGLRRRIADAALGDLAVADVHDIRARHVGHAIYVDLHAVVHPRMTVTEACVVADRVEQAVRRAVPEVRQVLVHVEPAREGAIIPVPGRSSE